MQIHRARRSGVTNFPRERPLSKKPLTEAARERAKRRIVELEDGLAKYHEVLEALRQYDSVELWDDEAFDRAAIRLDRTIDTVREFDGDVRSPWNWPDQYSFECDLGDRIYHLSRDIEYLVKRVAA
jgi:hypothetical protein